MAERTAKGRKRVRDLAARRTTARLAKGGFEIQGEPAPSDAQVRTTALWGLRVRPRV
jgi:hypothetical protein